MKSPSVPIALSIAGSDPSGGAGIQADLKAFHQHGVYGEAVITLLTVQNTKTVELVKTLDPDFVLKQLQAVLSDIPPHSAKTGALGSAEVIDAICMRAGSFNFPLVVDPVMVSKHGSLLLEADAAQILKRRLLAYAYLVTPNLHEAVMLSERDVYDEKSMERAALSISKLGAKNVLVKGGHLADQALDILYSEGQFIRLPAPRMETPHTHGTGCVYSAAITALLARGISLGQAVSRAKIYIGNAIASAPGLGQGNGPVNTFAPIGPNSR